METRSRRSIASRKALRSSASEHQDEITTDTDYSRSPSRVLMAGLTEASEVPLVEEGLGETPLKTRGLEQLRQKIEEELGKGPPSGGADSASPGLTRLRNTPGRGLKEKQRELIHKHEQIRQNSDRLNVGGGVTLWPNMNQMRLSGKEIAALVLACLVLVVLMGVLFLQLHGETLSSLSGFTSRVRAFGASHPIEGTGNVKSSILIWHSNFRNLLDGIDKSLNVSRPSAGYQAYIACYLMALGVLVYFLADNMFSNSKLSPGRIKKWVCLLVVVAQWTGMLCVMFVSAYKLESAIIDNVLQLSEKLGEFVERDLDLSTLGTVVQYWRGRCLPPAGAGVVRVLGLVPVQDVTVYLQYYSLPLLTVLLTPIVRLCLALRAVYTAPPQQGGGGGPPRDRRK
ncbi:uncharacterized protein LOC143282010 isoform X2 [Babylonia areolata]|uniref:uncharacterized protein LOC143282010 isoform X2 n=1 Tax=Babylonia areolata TaxID=304850 RepID=UPI003FD3350F